MVVRSHLLQRKSIHGGCMHGGIPHRVGVLEFEVGFIVLTTFASAMDNCNARGGRDWEKILNEAHSDLSSE